MSTETKHEAVAERLYGVLAEYPTPGALRKAARKVRDAGYKRWDCYSPFPVHGIDGDMGTRPTRLPLLVFGAGLVGCGGGILLQWWANAFDWPWLVSGKPIWSLPANIPIAFELTILLAAFTAFFGMWILNNLPQVWHPLFYKERFGKVTTGGFFLAIEAEDEEFELDATRALLDATSPTMVEDCHVPDDPAGRRFPKPLIAGLLMTTALTLVPLAYIARARTERSPEPHYHVIANMDFQPKHKAQTTSQIFADGRASRTPVAGTVARGELAADDHFYRGVEGGTFSSQLPAALEITDALVARGQHQFDVYCTPCHGASGKGDGMINRRAEKIGSPKWVTPTSLHQEYVVRMPHGQLFHTITHGARSMRGYAAQIAPADRWAIVLYVRALQRSQAASVTDVPADKRAEIR